MALFDKKKSFSKKEFEEKLGLDAGIIPGTGGLRYSKDERDKMSREVFGPEYGRDISKNDFRRAVQKLELTKLRARDERQRKTIDRKIRYLREFGGKNL